MTEQAPKFSSMPEADLPSRELVDATVRANTERLSAYGRYQQAVNERVEEITELIHDNPERVAADANKGTSQRTVFDKEHAHLIALATGGNEERLAADRRRSALGRIAMPWRGSGVGARRDMLGRMAGEKLADEAYFEDPYESTRQSVVNKKMRDDLLGDKTAKHIRPAKK